MINKPLNEINQIDTDKFKTHLLNKGMELSDFVELVELWHVSNYTSGDILASEAETKEIAQIAADKIKTHLLNEGMELTDFDELVDLWHVIHHSSRDILRREAESMSNK